MTRGKQPEKNVKTEAHTVYKNAEGKRLPSVTTITGTASDFSKQRGLMCWARDLALQGIDFENYRDELGDIGTLVHAMVEADMMMTTADLSQYSEAQIAAANISYEKYKAWEKGRDIMPVYIETPLVSEKYQYGGTMDFAGYVDGVGWIIDIKSSKYVHTENWFQLGALWQLVRENKADEFLPERCGILHIPHVVAGFKLEEVSDPSGDFEIFLNYLNAYKNRNKYGRT